MTCIIGHRDGWMVSDSMASDGNGRRFGGAVKKIYTVGDHTLIGVSGNAGFDFIAREAIEDAAQDVNRSVAVLGDWVRENYRDECGYVIVVVNTKRELWEIDSCGAILQVDSDYWAIGSGAETAQAFLSGIAYGRGATPQIDKITCNDGQIAIAHTASALTTVDNRCQTVSLYA